MEECRKDKDITIGQNIGYLISVGFVCTVLGFIISAQVKSYLQAEKIRIPETRKLDQLVMILKDTQNRKSHLEHQLLSLKKQINVLHKKEALPENLFNKQIKKLREVAGLTALKGNGVIIELDQDNNEKLTEYNDGNIQSDDLLKIVNELKASGAKAICVNNERIVTVSEIVKAGNNVMVNQTRLSSPYVIKAIGEPDTMIAALRLRGGIIESLEVFGIKVKIEKKPGLKIPPYSKNLL